jgi:outer membrane protein assembly factor BamB
VLLAAGALVAARPASPASSWPKLHFDAANSAFAVGAQGPALAALSRLRRRWQVTLDGVVWSSPAVERGRVVIGTESDVEAVSAATGRMLWRASLGQGVGAPPTVSGGRVFVGALGDGGVYALDLRSGRIVWRAQTGGSNVYGGALVAGGRVYVGADDGKLYAFDAANGAKEWTASAVGDHATPALVGGVVYTVGGVPGTVSALRASDGAVLWQVHTADFSGVSPTVHGGWIYLGDNSGDLYGRPARPCSAGCTWAWRDQIGSDDANEPKITGLAFAYATLFATATDGHVYAIDPHSGAVRWQGISPAPIVDAPSIAAGVVWLGTEDGHLVAFRAHGCGSARCSPVWSGAVGPPGEPLNSTPALAGGSVYVASYDRDLAAFAEARR